MLLNLLCIASLWLGIGLIAGRSILILMALGLRDSRQGGAAVRAVPRPRPGQQRAPFHVLACGGGPKPMSITQQPIHRMRTEESLISVPGGRR